MLQGPWDEAYYRQRQRIGRVHVKVGLPSEYMFTAMNRLMEDLHDVAVDVDPVEVNGRALGPAARSRALRRIADIEMAIMVGTYLEAREQRGLEALRDLLITHLPTAVLLIDKEGRVATSTTPWNHLFAHEDLRGKPVQGVLHGDVFAKAQLATHLARARETGREIIVPRIDAELGGHTRTLRIAVIPLQHPLADAILHIEDLTDTLASEARAKQAEHLAQLGTMAASVAHEIRNPLAGISGTVQVIARSLGEGDPRAVALGKVRDQIARLGSLVGDLLTFSRPIAPQLRAIDLATIAKHAIGEAAASTGFTAELEGAGTAIADAALLGQVLLNLVQNAFQAGAGRTILRIEPGFVAVLDDGPGVKPEDRARIFEPFFTTKLRGTGLGLPVARNMIEAMRGSLDVSTSPLGGAAFTVHLPKN